MRIVRWIWKKSCAAVLCGAFLCAMLPNAGFANDGDVSYEYYEDGILKLRGKYANNKPKGTWKYYTEDGKFERKEKF